MDRVSLSAEKYEQLFGSPPDPEAGADPELMAILRHVIFGEVFHIGELDDRTRELITVVVLTPTRRCRSCDHTQRRRSTLGCLQSRSARPSTSAPRSSASRRR